MIEKLIARFFNNCKETAKLADDAADQYVEIKIGLKGETENIHLVIDDEFVYEIMGNTLYTLYQNEGSYFQHLISLSEIVYITDEV